MQIKVRCECGVCKEWAILELQGSIEAHSSVHNHLQDLHIGTLCHVTQDKYILTIGYHELEGKKVSLKKPLLVLQKKKESDKMDTGKGSQTEFDVVGIIKQRILFKTRPKAIVSKPEVKEKNVKTLDSLFR